MARLHARRHRLLTRDQERDVFDRRYVIAQSSLDELSWKVYAQLPGMAGRALVDALDARVDEMPTDVPEARSTRYADALWAISADSLAGSDGATIDAAAPLLTVFMDATDATRTSGETGAWIE